MELNDIITLRPKSVVEKWRTHNDGSRSLLESMLVPEVAEALKDLARVDLQGGVLIGGSALAFYVKPRYTEDINLLYASRADIPDELSGFKRTRLGAFQHNKTHVEVEVVSPESINGNPQLIQQVIADAVESNGIKIVSKSGLVAMKLGRAVKGNKQDQVDIIQLIRSGGVDVSKFTLNDNETTLFKQLKDESNNDAYNGN